ncbi:MAG: hypothetical protein KIH69_005185 [Anaerolineae bacterium]|nr:hypothetical protein [Anaerolineae bacterium]
MSASPRRYLLIAALILLGLCLLCGCIAIFITSQGCFVSSGLGPLPYWRSPCPS